jgi:putative nucleotidyltransferase with HDIG domain
MQLADQYLDRVGHLPPAPTIANQLLGLFNEPDRDLDRVVQLISHDPSLTAEVLKRCNSAVFCGAEPASDMFEAITRLGFYEVYCVVTALIASRALTIAPKTSALDIGKYWEHSVITAVAASSLARRAEQPDAVAFTAGLLHDVGKLILAAVEPVAYGKILQTAGCNHAALVEAEIAQFKVSHAMVGAQLLARWKLPSSVVAPVLQHHEAAPALQPFVPLWAAVRLGDGIAHSLKDSSVNLMEASGEDFRAMSILGVSPDQLPDILAEIADGLKGVEALFQIAA